jgi:hypothetical protein
MGRKAASGMGDFLDMKGCCTLIKYGKGMGQFLPFKDWLEGVGGFIHMENGHIFSLRGEGPIQIEKKGKQED